MQKQICRFMILLVSFWGLSGSCKAESKSRGDAKLTARQTDVLIYGATPAGIAAAINVARSGRSVTLVTPYNEIGGLATNGLSNTDFHSFEGLTGTFLIFANKVHQYYIDKYGRESEQVKDGFRGTHGEPHVNLHVFKEMLAEFPRTSVEKNWQLSNVDVSDDHRINKCLFTIPGENSVEVAAKIFIDATYEGDLMAQAGVPFRVGREGRDEYGESLAPEVADEEVQGYNFRFVMTQNPENRVPIAAPEGYDPKAFESVLPLLESGKIKTVFCARRDGLYKAHLPPLPNQKHDINDVSRNVVRLSIPQINNAWPDGDQATRDQIFKEHLRHNIGLLYFVQTDSRVPEAYRDEALTWGWCKDEFASTGHIPEQLYIREARRMVGQHVFTQHDCQNAAGDARAVFFPDAIAIGEYSLNCHGTGHQGPLIGGSHTGEFYQVTPPYQIPYGSICPKEVNNLLVPVAVSASHVGFCGLRLEPIWTSLGDAAGVAAELAIQNGQSVQDVSPVEIRRQLHRTGAATIYVTDVLAGHPHFEAVQWWGSLGGLHGLEDKPEGRPRGKTITGQYCEAYLAHEVKLDEPLDSATRQRWLKLCMDNNLQIKDPAALKSRGEFILAAFQANK